MSKENNLYFLNILMKAFESGGSDVAFRRALIEITELGKQEEYREGYEQFCQFLDSGITNDDDIENELVKKTLVGLATDNLSLEREEVENIVEKIKLNKSLYSRYNQILQEPRMNIPILIEIYLNEIIQESSQISKSEDEIIFTNVVPGKYTIRLSNGRVLWKGEITREDVLIDESFSSREYKLAAETDEVDVKPTRTIELIKDEIKLYVYAGLEFGRFKIIIK